MLCLHFIPAHLQEYVQKNFVRYVTQCSNFNNLNLHVIGISVDSPFANKAFALQNNLQFPLLSDYTREVSKQYGGIHEDFAGIKGYSASKRAIFIVDSNDKVKYAWISENPGVEPDYDAITQASKVN